MPTFVFYVHFRFQGLEVIGEIGLDFTPHPLSGPLFEAIEFLIDNHLGIICEKDRCKRSVIMEEDRSRGERM